MSKIRQPLAALLLLPALALAQDCPPLWQRAFPVDTDLYPFTDRCLELSQGIIHYFDERPAGVERGTVLMVHGNPTWSFLYRDIAQSLLADDYRVIAADHYGFGLSDKPEDFPYSARSHAETMAQFVQALDLQDVIAVVHDWGGPIGLWVAEDQPERFSGVVILNTWAWTMSPELAPYFHDAINWAGRQVRHTDYLLATGAMPKRVGQNLAALHGEPGSQPYLAVRNAYWGPFLDLQTGLPLSEAAMLPTNRPYHHLDIDPAFLHEVESDLHRINDRPMALVIGSYDSLFGALRCNNGACPPEAHCETLYGQEVCLHNQSGRLLFPTIDEFVSRWQPGQVVDIVRSRTGSHFVQEYETEAIAAAVRVVNDF